MPPDAAGLQVDHVYRSTRRYGRSRSSDRRRGRISDAYRPPPRRPAGHRAVGAGRRHHAARHQPGPVGRLLPGQLGFARWTGAGQRGAGVRRTAGWCCAGWPDIAPINRRLVHLNLEVADIQAAYDDLRGRGVTFVHRPRAVSRHEQLELWSAAFRDPDGHGIALTRWDLRQPRMSGAP